MFAFIFVCAMMVYIVGILLSAITIADDAVDDNKYNKYKLKGFLLEAEIFLRVFVWPIFSIKALYRLFGKVAADIKEDIKTLNGENMKLEIGKKYRVRDSKNIKYVEIIGVYNGPINYDFEGRVVYESGYTFIDSYMSNGGYLASGRESTVDLVEEYKPNSLTIEYIEGSTLTPAEAKAALKDKKLVKIGELVYGLSGEDTLLYIGSENQLRISAYSGDRVVDCNSDSFKQPKCVYKSISNLLKEGATFDEDGYLCKDEWACSIPPKDLYLFDGKTEAPDDEAIYWTELEKV